MTGSHSRGVLLIVEDDSTVNKILAHVFADMTCSTHRDLASARTWLEAGNAFSVALIDKHLPDGSGLEFVEWLRGRAPECEALLMTADSNIDSAIAAMKVGVSDYLRKPFKDLEAVRLRVSDAFEKVALKNQRLELLERVAHAASHDALTGLANRAAFLERLAATLAELERAPDRLFAVLFVDVDRFGNINDNLGHGEGDKLLCAVSDRLRGCVRNVDTVARMGGDEFTILLREVRDPNDALRVAERIHESLQATFELGERSVYVSASIGIALSCDTSGSERRMPSAETLMREADLAMYRAKGLGRARSQIFSAQLQTRAQRAWQLESTLRAALQSGEVSAAFQPIVRVGDGRVEGFEALVRWSSPEHGAVPALELVDIAEDTGLIGAVFDQVLDMAARQLRACQSLTGRDDLFMGVNLSGKQLSDTTLVDRLLATLARIGVSPRTLELEITESVLMDDPKNAMASLERLRAAGVSLTIDDFGTGYSSLSYLSRLPVSTLKIDRSFVVEMAQGNGRNIVGFIIDLARKLNLRVIAEGVESGDQMSALAAEGCALAQGFYFARPMPAADLASWLQQGKR